MLPRLLIDGREETAMVVQRTWVSVVREAVRRHVAGIDRALTGESYHAIDAMDLGDEGTYVVLVTDAAGRHGAWDVGLYLPGSAAEGECDWYGVVGDDGEEIETAESGRGCAECEDEEQ